MADWQVIRTEYEAGASLRQLAAKHGISKSLIGKKKFEEQWTAKVDSGQPQVQQNTDVTPQKADPKILFLDSFTHHGIVTHAARDAGIHRKTVYDWLEHDEDFSFAFNQAKEAAKDEIRAEIRRRGHDGFDEQVLVGGKIHTVHKYSDTLLIFHAKMLMPEYRDKSQIEMSGSLDITGARETLLTKLGTITRATHNDQNEID